MRILANFFVLVTFFVFFVGNVFAGFDCVVDSRIIVPTAVPSQPAPTPDIRCVDMGAGSGIYPSVKECLQGAGNICPPGASPHCIPAPVVPPCKSDPRYQLRNFAPFLNFPTIGSMLNLGVALITAAAGLLCGVIMFYGAYKYLSAGGEPKKIEDARNRMIYAVIGLIVVLLAYSIVKVLLDITSTNTVGF